MKKTGMYLFVNEYLHYSLDYSMKAAREGLLKCPGLTFQNNATEAERTTRTCYMMLAGMGSTGYWDQWNKTKPLLKNLPQWNKYSKKFDVVPLVGDQYITNSGSGATLINHKAGSNWLMKDFSVQWYKKSALNGRTPIGTRTFYWTTGDNVSLIK